MGGLAGGDHLSGDLRGPDSPCFRPPLPRDKGGGVLLCEGGVRGGAALARNMWPRWGAVRGRGGVQHAAASGRGVCL